MASKGDPKPLYCCNCSSSVGPQVRVQPVAVTMYDGSGKQETWCPRCFVWKRMNIEPERWNASCTAAVTCQFCGFVSVCFTVMKGRANCAHCGAHGAMLIRPEQGEIEKIYKTALAVAEETRSKS